MIRRLGLTKIHPLIVGVVPYKGKFYVICKVAIFYTIAFLQFALNQCFVHHSLLAGTIKIFMQSSHTSSALKIAIVVGTKNYSFSTTVSAIIPCFG